MTGAPRLGETNSWLGVRRYTRDARYYRGKPQRQQRRFRTEEQARAAIVKWKADDDTKAVWLWGPAPLRESGKPDVRPELEHWNRANG